MIPIKSIFQEKKDKLDALKTMFRTINDRTMGNISEMADLRKKIHEDEMELLRIKDEISKVSEELKALK